MKMLEYIWDYSKLHGATGSIFASFFQYDEMNENIGNIIGYENNI